MLFPPRRICILLVLIALLAAAAVPRADAQVPGLRGASIHPVSLADTTNGNRGHALDTSFKIYPAPLWSRSAGFAAGVGYEIENLVIPGTRILATARPGQHLGRYTFTYFVRDAYEDPVYGLADAYYDAAGRHWYYGLGPTSSLENELAVEKDHFEGEIRVGVRPLGGRLLLQPSIAYIRHDVHGYRSFDDGAFGRLSPESRQNLLFAAGIAGEPAVGLATLEGHALGLSVAIDLRDRPSRARRGVLLQGSLRRFDFAGAPDVAYDRYEAQSYGYVPIGFNRLSLRLLAQLTEPRTDAPIPFYLLPSVNGRLLPGYSWNRFYGNDLFAASVEYAMSLFDILEFAALDALLSVGAGNVYNDLFEEFEPSVSFNRTLDDAASYPLRPSAAIGFHIESFDAGGWNMRVLLGWGAEGVRLVRFGFVDDLRRVERRKR